MYEIIEYHYRKNYNKLVKSTTYRVIGKSTALAEEVVQEAYTRAVQYFPSFDENIKPFDAWFRTILNNTLRDHKSQEKGYAMNIDDILEEGIVPIIPEQDLINKVEELIAKQSEDNQEILTLWFKYGYKPREISEISSTSPVNIRKVISNFRKSIANIIQKDV